MTQFQCSKDLWMSAWRNKIEHFYRLPREALLCLIKVVYPILTSLTKGHVSEVAALIRDKITL